MGDAGGSPSLGKICIFCGKDCAGQPRGKDPKGRYYHLACVEERKRKRESEMLLEDVELAPPRTPEVMASPPPVTAARQCANCGARLAPDAVICVSCGLNLQSGKQVEMTAAAPRGASSGATAWPIGFGVVSIVLGGIGTLLYGFWLIIGIAATDWGEVGLAGLIGVAIVAFPFLMSLWLLIGGIGTVQRRQKGVAHLRRWSIYSAIVGAALVGCLSFVLLRGPQSDVEVPVDRGALIVGLATIAAAFLAWPITILIWTSRSAIQAEVKQWR